VLKGREEESLTTVRNSSTKYEDHKTTKKLRSGTKDDSLPQMPLNMNHRKVTKPKWRQDPPVHPARIMTSQLSDPRDFDSEFRREVLMKAL